MQAVNKIPVLYRTKYSITVFTENVITTYHEPREYRLSSHTLVKCNYNICTTSTPRSTNWTLPLTFTFVCGSQQLSVTVSKTCIMYVLGSNLGWVTMYTLFIFSLYKRMPRENFRIPRDSLLPGFFLLVILDLGVCLAETVSSGILTITNRRRETKLMFENG
jgi:hypothetical protein